ncbi:hypothetical protein SPAB_05602 [Salmonella enterica subsp. enterica serovar Paratyphi B str. SPB7]|uniref:Uncharacterized protein n=1 Tax=Salmonella paratyphi B (strain ATCC BAA-1250 / SPB7) TaxID=1016998 RepID=A0A6C6ZBC6_SALPB|nr:hypothetical protein SPAB_05602 [Salmonella enterica subsp. enterica serovar Paratyphi B str. SPB7]
MPPCYNTNCLEETHEIGTIASGCRPDKVFTPPSGIYALQTED